MHAALSSILWYEGGLCLGCARLCSIGSSWEDDEDIHLSKDIDCDRTGSSKSDFLRFRNVKFPFCV